MTSIKFNETNLLTSVNDQDNSINYYEENVNKLQKRRKICQYINIEL